MLGTGESVVASEKSFMVFQEFRFPIIFLPPFCWHPGSITKLGKYETCLKNVPCRNLSRGRLGSRWQVCWAVLVFHSLRASGYRALSLSWLQGPRCHCCAESPKHRVWEGVGWWACTTVRAGRGCRHARMEILNIALSAQSAGTSSACETATR